MTADEIIHKLLQAIEDVGDYNDGCGCCGSGAKVSTDKDVCDAVTDAENYLLNKE